MNTWVKTDLTMPNRNYETYPNLEPLRACIYCDWEGTSRELAGHVLNSADEGHGEKYDTPDEFEATEAEIVGHEGVELDIPEEYNIAKKLRYVCDYCGRVCKRKSGIGAHLSQMAGDSVHPEDGTDRDADSFPTFKVPKEGELVTQDDSSLFVATGGIAGLSEGELDTQEVVPIEELKQLRELFMETAKEYESLSPVGAAEMVEEVIDKYE